MKIYLTSKLFSKNKKSKGKKKKDDSDSKKAAIGSGLAGVGLMVGGYGVNKHYNKKMKENFGKPIDSEQKALYDKLKQDIKKRGVRIEDEKDWKIGGNSNAAYVGKDKKLEKQLKPYTDKQIDGAYDQEINKIKNNKNLTRAQKKQQIEAIEANRPAAKMRGKGGFIIDKDMKSGDVLSHEMGHEHYMSGKGKGFKSVGGVLHKGRTSKIINNTRGLSYLGSFASGMNAAKHEKEGTEEEKISKYGHLVLPGARAASLVGSEAAASIKGHKLLKKSGASKKALKTSRRNLGTALGTYAGVAALDLGANLAARGAGKFVGRRMHDDD